MTPAEARTYFDAAIARAADPDQVARLEIAREFFCNPEFRRALSLETYRLVEAMEAMAD